VFLKRTVEKNSYRKLIGNFYFVYSAMEEEMERHGTNFIKNLLPTAEPAAFGTRPQLLRSQLARANLSAGEVTRSGFGKYRIQPLNC